MGVYIPNMEMPTSCAYCRFLQSNGEIFKRELFCGLDSTNDIHGYKPNKGCPLIPVPPHGRLIEESKVLDIVFEWCPDDDGSVGKVGDLREMLDEIEALTTIIPAEEGE